jgi:5-methylcytosine-specific restriction endonuclease McrA
MSENAERGKVVMNITELLTVLLLLSPCAFGLFCLFQATRPSETSPEQEQWKRIQRKILANPATKHRRTYVASTYYPNYPEDWQELKHQVLVRDGYRCANCGGTGEMHVHHIVPLANGGSNQLTNLKALCKDCHQRIHPHMKGGVKDFD